MKKAARILTIIGIIGTGISSIILFGVSLFLLISSKIPELLPDPTLTSIFFVYGIILLVSSIYMIIPIVLGVIVLKKEQTVTCKK